jgi:hypothetical protein
MEHQRARHACISELEGSADALTKLLVRVRSPLPNAYSVSRRRKGTSRRGGLLLHEDDIVSLRAAQDVALVAKEAMSILKTELKKDECARDIEAMERATFFLSLIEESALIDQVHRECAPDSGGTKFRVQNQATGSGSGSRSRAQTRR